MRLWRRCLACPGTSSQTRRSCGLQSLILNDAKKRTFIAWLLLLLLLTTGANYYLNLGFLPRFARLLMSLPVWAIRISHALPLHSR